MSLDVKEHGSPFPVTRRWNRIIAMFPASHCLQIPAFAKLPAPISPTSCGVENASTVCHPQGGVVLCADLHDPCDLPWWICTPRAHYTAPESRGYSRPVRRGFAGCVGR